MKWPLWFVRRRVAHWQREVTRHRNRMRHAIDNRLTSEERYAEADVTVALGKVQIWRRRLPR